MMIRTGFDDFSNHSQLRELLNSRKVCSSCCGMCFAIFQDKYIEGYFSDNDLSAIKDNPGYRQSWLSFQNLDHIRRGKVLEKLLFEVKQINSCEDVDALKFSGLLGHLKFLYGLNFFKDELDGTYARSLIQAWESKLKERSKRSEARELEQKEVKERNQLANELKKLRKDIKKNENEIVRKTFLYNFSKLDSISKFRTILNGMEIPLLSIPDSYFCSPNLDLRFKLRGEFNQDELKELRKIFGSDLKRNKRKIFRQILKVLR